MESNHLKALIEVVNSDFNLTTASKKLFMSQSALSQLISKYELEYSILLFNRSKGRLTGLTPIGKAVYQYAQEIDLLFKDLTEEVAQINEKESDIIRVGIPVLALNSLPSDFFSNFQVLYPNIKLDIIEGNSESLLLLLDKHQLDIALVLDSRLSDKNQYESNRVLATALVAVFDKNHPLEKKVKLSLEDIANYPLSLFNENYEINSLIKNKFEEKDLNANINFISSSWELLVSSTLNDTKITFLPSTYCEKIDKNLYTYKKLDPSIMLNLCVSRLKKYDYTFFKNTIYKQLSNESIWTEKEE